MKIILVISFFAEVKNISRQTKFEKKMEPEREWNHQTLRNGNQLGDYNEQEMRWQRSADPIHESQQKDHLEK